MASKTVTREQAEAKRQKAVDFLNHMGDTDAADEFDSMSTDEYAEHKGLTLTNPNRKRRKCMANIAPTKSDLQDTLDQIQEILEAAYTPESSREDLAAAVGDALDALAPPEDTDEDEDVDEDDDDDNGNGAD